MELSEAVLYRNHPIIIRRNITTNLTQILDIISNTEIQNLKSKFVNKSVLITVLDKSVVLTVEIGVAQ